MAFMYLDKSFIAPLGITVLTVLGSCDSSAILPESQTSADTPSLGKTYPFTPGNGCGLGTYQAVFDDFAYTNDNMGASGSLFNDEAWWTCNGSTKVTKNSRFWYRYNWSELDGHWDDNDNYATFEGSGYQTKMKLNLPSGHVAGSAGPEIRSGSLTKNGTYAARVRFSDLPGFSGADVIQAFWTQDPVDGGPTYEMDLEWTNYFGGDKTRLQAANHNGSASTGDYLDCVYYTNVGGNQWEGKTDCLWNGSDESGVIGKAEPLGNSYSGPEGQEYLTLLIRYDGSVVEYAYKDDGYRGDPGTLWGGNGTASGDFGNALEISSNRPTEFMDLMFGVIHEFGSTSSQEYSLRVEWVYFSPDYNLLNNKTPYEAINAIESDVQSFRNNARVRVNTALNSLDH